MTKHVVFVQPKSTGGNFEYVAIPRQGMTFLSAALKQYVERGNQSGERIVNWTYDTRIWFEDKVGELDPDKDLDGVDILCMSGLINEIPRAYALTLAARKAHPNLKIMGGGPHMGFLYDEAFEHGAFDVIVQHEGEDVIGPLADILLHFPADRVNAELNKIGGIAYQDGAGSTLTPKRRTIPSDFVELPDYRAVVGLSPASPWAAGVLETVRGCTENCSYCEVIKQFLGYRMVGREVEWKRLEQLQQLADEGLIMRSPYDGRFAVFVTDDLHPPPSRATKFHQERLERARSWKGRTDGMWMVCQTRTELGDSPELAETLRDIGMEMLYLGVESNNAENLNAVKKRQDPNDVDRNLRTLQAMGFTNVAMTIIGLPFDTEEKILAMADWALEVSRYQTANLLTPLPATINWDLLKPLDEDGSLLPPGKIRPYHMYNGKRLVHYDKRWTMQESEELYRKYTDRLRPVDRLYQRIFQMIERRARQGQGAVPQKIVRPEAMVGA
ncbi:MAG: B12-binding domain-containing radical SAM protein [Dehalococcoidia bacterium]|nr:B12-binding domain-containing radical SAM protein [Dehalococcoidia bacterium]